MSQTINITPSLDGKVVGKSLYWGDSSNSNNTDDTSFTNSQEDLDEFGAYHSPIYRVRFLMRFDLSQIPRNAHIRSAKLRLRATNRDSNPANDNYLDIYRCDIVPWNGSASFSKYDGTHNWPSGQYGLVPGEDYTSELKGTFLFNKEYWSGWKYIYSDDLSDLIAYSIDKDNMELDIMMRLRHRPGSYSGNGPTDYQAGAILMSEYGTPAYRPTFIITYDEPLAFYDSDESGNINEDAKIEIGADSLRIGSVIHSNTETTYQDNPRKIFCKNQLLDITAQNVHVYSPDNWATYPIPDDANTGNGSVSDVTTSSTDTIDENWKIEFTDATNFTVYRDGGTGNEPGQTQTWTQDGTGTIGDQYSSTTRGIGFTITAGGTAFASGDKFYFTTYKDYSISGAPTDSDYLLEICGDNDGTPDGNWYFARTARTSLNQDCSASNTLHVVNAKYFNPNNKIKIYNKSTHEWSQWYTVQSVNRDNNTITLASNVTAASGSLVHAQGLYIGNIPGNSAKPFWVRGVSFIDTDKETKQIYLRAIEEL